MKLKTNNKFSRWLFKLACKFGYSPLLPELKTIYITPKNFIKLSCVIKVPEAECIRIPEGYTNQVDFINQMLCYEFVKNPEFRHNIKLTSKFNPEDNTTTIYAKLFILDKKGLEDFYERY
jgi:hypothetical protein